MKPFLRSLPALAVLLCAMVGCSSLEPYDGVKRTPKTTIAIFEASTVPDRPYKVIMEFSAEGNGGEESNKHRGFVKQAKKLGADAILFRPTQSGGFQFHTLGGMGGGNTAVYTAVAVVYQ